MSRFARPLSTSEIDAIGEYSARRNRGDGITGVLLTLSSLFFQIIEGDDDPVDALYERVVGDERHTEVVCLRTELDVEARLFPDWSMRVIRLDAATDDVMRAVTLLLDRMGEAQQIVEHYTQPAVSRIMASGLNPLEEPLRTVDRVVLFADMVGFSTITASQPVENVSALVTTYLDVLSGCVTAHGGEVTTFLGDGLLAYFEDDQVDNAVEACLDGVAELGRIRRTAPQGSPLRGLRGGFGVDRGRVVEGNLGSSVKVDYTIVGEPVNTAARLEALTRELRRPVLVSGAVVRGSRRPQEFDALGDHRLMGYERAVAVYAPRARRA